MHIIYVDLARTQITKKWYKSPKNQNESDAYRRRNQNPSHIALNTQSEPFNLFLATLKHIAFHNTYSVIIHST